MLLFFEVNTKQKLCLSVCVHGAIPNSIGDIHMKDTCGKGSIADKSKSNIAEAEAKAISRNPWLSNAESSKPRTKPTVTQGFNRPKSPQERSSRGTHSIPKAIRVSPKAMFTTVSQSPQLKDKIRSNIFRKYRRKTAGAHSQIRSSPAAITPSSLKVRIRINSQVSPRQPEAETTAARGQKPW